MPFTRIVCAQLFTELQSTIFYTSPLLNHRNNNTKMTNYIKIIRYLFFVPSRIDTMVWQYVRWLESRSFRNGEKKVLFRNGHDSVSHRRDICARNNQSFLDSTQLHRATCRSEFARAYSGSCASTACESDSVTCSCKRSCSFSQAYESLHLDLDTSCGRKTITSGLAP